MLQVIVNEQSTLKQELVSRIDKLDSKLGWRIDGLDIKLDKVEKNLTERIDYCIWDNWLIYRSI